MGRSRNTVASTIRRGTADVPKRIKNKPVRTNELIEAIEATINEKKGKTTVSGLAHEFDIERRTMGRLVKNALGLNMYKRTPRQALTDSDCNKRMNRSKILLNKPETVVIFSDETPFSLGGDCGL